MQPRVRDVQARLVELFGAVEEEVEVERARPLRRAAAAAAAEAVLDGEERVEQLTCAEIGLERGRAVQEPRLVEEPDRLRVAQLRDVDDRDPRLGGERGERVAERPFPVAEVRAEGDVGAHHAPRVPLLQRPGATAAADRCGAAVAATPVAAAPGRISGEPAQGQEWWLAAIGADRATPPGPGVPLTVVDGGLDVSNPDFAGRPDTIRLDDQTAAESDYHGTQVALLAAAPANGAGLLGVYPQAVLQSWDASPAGSLVVGSAADGIKTAAERCPGVVNLSFGSTTRYRRSRMPSSMPSIAAASSSPRAGTSGRPATCRRPRRRCRTS